MKRHITSQCPNSFCRMQTCMRPSFDSRTGKFAGTVAVPCFEVTTSRRMPVPAGTDQVAFSTGAQSLLLQHSIGYQSCAFAGAEEKCTTVARTGRVTRTALIMVILPTAGFIPVVDGLRMA
jgi:hypothetical protein